MAYNDQAAANIFVTSGQREGDSGICVSMQQKILSCYSGEQMLCSKRYYRVTVEKNAVQCHIAIVHGGIYLSLSI